MVHGGYDGGGQCLLQFFFFFPVQWHQPFFFFFFTSLFASVWFFYFWSLVGVELLVAFRRCGGGCWPVELLWGATMALILFIQRREPMFFFSYWLILPSQSFCLLNLFSIQSSQWWCCCSGGEEEQRWFSFSLLPL